MSNTTIHADSATTDGLRPSVDSTRASINPNDLAELCEQQIGRRDTRVAIERPVEVIGVGLDGTLDESLRTSGCSREISEGGILVELTGGQFYNSQPLLLGIHLATDGVSYAGVLVKRIQLLANHAVRLGMEFGGPAAEVLTTGMLMPHFDRELMAFVMPHSSRIYDSWVDAGVVEKTILDRVRGCHRCGALPPVRNACRQCTSGRLTTDRLIHHFASAYVGFVTDFEQAPGELTCPKCRMPKLVVGSDFEYLTGQHRCRSCGWRDSEAELCGHCLRCGNRFELSQAREQELYRYDVHQLDPLAVTTDMA